MRPVACGPLRRLLVVVRRVGPFARLEAASRPRGHAGTRQKRRAGAASRTLHHGSRRLIGVAVVISVISAYEPSRANDVAALRHTQQVQCQSQHAVA